MCLYLTFIANEWSADKVRSYQFNRMVLLHRLNCEVYYTLADCQLGYNGKIFALDKLISPSNVRNGIKIFIRVDHATLIKLHKLLSESRHPESLYEVIVNDSSFYLDVELGLVPIETEISNETTERILGHHVSNSNWYGKLCSTPWTMLQYNLASTVMLGYLKNWCKVCKFKDVTYCTTCHRSDGTKMSMHLILPFLYLVHTRENFVNVAQEFAIYVIYKIMQTIRKVNMWQLIELNPDSLTDYHLVLLRLLRLDGYDSHNDNRAILPQVTPVDLSVYRNRSQLMRVVGTCKWIKEKGDFGEAFTIKDSNEVGIPNEFSVFYKHLITSRKV